jgi:hypothetical protein
MGQKQLNNLLLRHLKNINRTTKKITGSTIYKTILRNDDGAGGLSTSALYQLLVANSIKGIRNNIAYWPLNWLELSVSDLTKHINR